MSTMMNSLAGGTLTKLIPARWQFVTFDWIHREFMVFSVFKAAREKIGLKSFGCCWWCERPFDDADMMALAKQAKGANRVLCQICVAQVSPV